MAFFHFPFFFFFFFISFLAISLIQGVGLVGLLQSIIIEWKVQLILVYLCILTSLVLIRMLVDMFLSMPTGSSD